MIYATLGLPGPLTAWCQTVTTQLLIAAGRRVDDVTSTGSLTDVGRQLILCEKDHLVVAVSRPDNDLANALRDSKKPILLALSDPRRSLIHLVENGDLDVLTAIRSISGDCSCLINLADCETVAPIRFEQVLEAPLAVIAEIARLYNLSVSPMQVHRIAQDTHELVELMVAPENGGTDIETTWTSNLDENLARAGQFMLTGLDRHLAGQRAAPIVVTKELFLNGEPPHEAVSAPVDMTGRSRYVAFGPFIHLPAGTWLLRYMISFSEEAVGVPCLIDVCASDQFGVHELTRTHVVISTAGRMDVTLAFQHNDPLASLQVRLLTEKPVFDGRLAIGFAEFTLKPEGPTDPELFLPT